jgi:hypothetical protein
VRSFDFSAAMRFLCGDIVRRLDAFRHVDMASVAITVTKARKNVSHGMQASLTPLRFECGEETAVRDGRRYQLERILRPDGRDYLYLLTFFLPRFQNHAFEEKLTTVIHELWHISPRCDGDLRRHRGRFYAHGPSQRAYDANAAALARQWLALDPPLHLYAFLGYTFGELEREYGRVTGRRVRAPRLIAVNDP